MRLVLSVDVLLFIQFAGLLRVKFLAFIVNREQTACYVAEDPAKEEYKIDSDGRSARLGENYCYSICLSLLLFRTSPAQNNVGVLFLNL